MEVLGVIPARGGSKALPKKNLVLLRGRPLLSYTCEVALQSKKITRIMVSTDDEEIAAVARGCHVEVPFLRPSILAQDETPVLDVLRDLLSSLATRERYEPDVVVLLQPTSPFRRPEDIDAGIDLLLSSRADSVVSVIEVPHRFSPTSVLVIRDGKLIPFLGGETVTRRQDKPLLYARNGPAVLAVWRRVLLKKGLYGDDVRPLLMEREHSLDIDDEWDFVVANALLEGRKGS